MLLLNPSTSLPVDTTASAVLADNESKLYGWTLISPTTFGHVRDSSFEEKILILTAKALYACMSSVLRETSSLRASQLLL